MKRIVSLASVVVFVLCLSQGISAKNDQMYIPEETGECTVGCNGTPPCDITCIYVKKCIRLHGVHVICDGDTLTCVESCPPPE